MLVDSVKSTGELLANDHFELSARIHAQWYAARAGLSDDPIYDAMRDEWDIISVENKSNLENLEESIEMTKELISQMQEYMDMLYDQIPYMVEQS